MSLSEQDREALSVAFRMSAYLERTGHGTAEFASFEDDALEKLEPAVEALIARHVTAAKAEALDEAVAEIEALREQQSAWPPVRTRADLHASDAYIWAAGAVRHLRNQHRPT